VASPIVIADNHSAGPLKETYVRLRLLSIAVILLMPGYVLVAGTGSLRRGSKPKLAGTWQVNRERSTNGRSELPGQLDSESNILTEVTSERWSQVEADYRAEELLEATELLNIFMRGGEITINATGGLDVVLTRTMQTDGRLSEQAIGPGLRGSSRAEWREDTLVIETVLTDDMTVTEDYDLSKDGSSLVVTVRLENASWSQPLIIERFYDRLS
jgi:hypothetical protein